MLIFLNFRRNAKLVLIQVIEEQIPNYVKKKNPIEYAGCFFALNND